MIVVYHHDDNDGYVAAAITLAALGNADVTRLTGNYSETINTELLDRAAQIYLLDYRFPVDLMDRYFDKLIWIDHHVTAIESVQPILAQRGRDFEGIQVIGTSGCLLTWRYFHPTKKTPLVIQLVNDRDVWNWDLGEDTAAFHEVSRAFVADPAVWNVLIANDRETNRKVREGHKLLGFVRSVLMPLIEEKAWVQTFEGHQAAFLNLPTSISGETHRLLKKHYEGRGIDFVVLFTQRADKVQVGMYRAETKPHLDLSKIAKRYGGGGHSGAAGFTVSLNEWARLLPTMM